MSFYDGGQRPNADHDPQQQIQWEIQRIANSIGQDLTAIVTQLIDAAKAALEETIKEVVDKIVGFVTDPTTFLTELGSWSTQVPLLDTVTGLLFAGWIPGLDASKIVSGLFSMSQVGGLAERFADMDATILAIPGAQAVIDAICNALGIPGSGHVPSDIITALTNIPGLNIVSSILSSIVPGLDASKITSGSFGQSMITGLPALLSAFPGENIVGTVLSSVVPGLDASKITSGLFSQSQINGLPTSLASLLPFNIFNQSAIAGSNLFISPDFEDTTILRPAHNGGYSTEQAHSGVHSWKLQGNGAERDLSICPLSTDVLFDYDTTAFRVRPGSKYYIEAWVKGKDTNAGGGNMGLWNSFGDSTGVLSGDWPNWDTQAGEDFTPNNTGGTAWVKISGRITVPPGYDRWLPYVYVSTPATDYTYIDDILVREETASQNIIAQLFGGTTILSTILGSAIPGLDASKVTTGQFPQSMLNITSIASSILTGTLGTGLIPGLDASKITSGAFPQSMITGLTALLSAFPGSNLIGSVASSLLSGTIGTGLIPGLDASKITSGQFPQSMVSITNIAAGIVSGVLGAGQIPGIDASKIVSGTITEVVTGLGTLRDSFVNGLFGGGTGTGFTNTQATNQATLVAQQAAAAAASAAAAQDQLAQQVQDASAGTGTNFHTPFGGADGGALTADWNPNNGNIVLRGSQGYMGIKSGLADGTYATAGTVPATTNDQRVSVVLGDQGGSTNAVTRVLWHTATGTTLGGAVLIIANDSLKFGFLSAANVFTQIGATYSATFSQGTKIDAFNVGNVFTVNVNGTPRITGTDAGNLITLANKFTAVRMDQFTDAGGWFVGPTTYHSFRLSSFGIADYSTAVAGSSTASWKISRASTTNVAITVGNGAAANFPASFFATTDYTSGATVTTLGTGVITILTAGYYELACSVSATQTPPSVASGPGQVAFPWAIAVNGAQATGAIPSGVPHRIHLNAGDTVQPMLTAVGDGQTSCSSQTASNAFAGAPMACTGVRGFAHFSGLLVAA